jgi:L-ascorbate metabolism protein UlaG (beta-lactamase superfamily)
MKRIFPERSYGRFVCCEGLSHDWFFPVVKTLLHSCTILWNPQAKPDGHILTCPLSFPQRSEQPKITWLGHSTFLIQVAGKNILTDPIFGSLSIVFRRLMPCPVKISDLPPIDYVLISHNHFDHMDSTSLHQIKAYFPQVKILVPMGDKEWFDRHLFSQVSEHTWWEEIVESAGALKFTFLPANHWSQRTLFDKNRSLWGSWMVQAQNFSIYFAGDTSWGDHFEQIGASFEHIDIALLPIAPGEPRSWMKDSHINAREAVLAFIKLKAKMLVPMHWGTFHLGFDDFYAPVKLLQQTWHEFAHELQARQLRIVKFGELISYVRDQLIFSVTSISQQQTL